MKYSVAFWVYAIVFGLPASVGEIRIPAGPNREEIENASSFGLSDRVVATHYFYWYKWPNEHFFDNPANRERDTLHCHFVDQTRVDYESAAWHRRQMEDMLAAGIDIALPVYWGTPNQYDKPGVSFSVRGLGPLTQALDEIAAEGRTPPRIGMFYDTTTLLASYAFTDGRSENVDLRTDEGKEIFYRTIRDFFRLVPPRHWACLDGRPIVALYDSAFASGHDQSTIDYVYEHFAADFAGRKPYVISGPSWHFKADARTGWGAALGGPILGDNAAQVGPGYDDSPVIGRNSPTRDRLGGGFYAASWLLAIQRRPRIVVVETWSELHEGTPICETLEDGRKYIELTRRFADLYKADRQPSVEDWADSLRIVLNAPRSNRWGREFAGRVVLAARAEAAAKMVEEGVRLVRDVTDGACEIETVGAVACVRTKEGINNARYLYFDVADPCYYDHSGTLAVKVTYLDAGRGEILVQYDSSEPIGPLDGAYREGGRIHRTDSGEWRTATVELPRARCTNRQNGGADFRLESLGGELAVSSVEVTQPGLAEGR